MKKLIEKLTKIDQFEKNLGLDKTEIEKLNDCLGFEIPFFFVEYLQLFGFNENLFWTIFNDEEEFIQQNEFIHEEDNYRNYLIIGDEYAENFILVNKENQQLFLLEDDHLFDLKITFDEMLDEIVESLQSINYDSYKQIDTIYQSLLSNKNLIATSIKLAIDNLKEDASQNNDLLYSIIISTNPKNEYNIYGGSLEDFKIGIDSENINYDKLWNTNFSKYQQKINDKFIDQKYDFTYIKALELIYLDVLRDLKNEGYFNDQALNISVSLKSTETNLFPEDSYEESLMKKNDLTTKIKRFWETPYDRTRLIIEAL